MQPTILGTVLVAVTIWTVRRPERLLPLILIASVFEAGAALIVGGSFGLPTAMVPGLLFIAYIVLQYACGMRYPGERQVLWTLTPLLLLFCYAAASIVVLPDMFAGRVMVWPQKPDPISPGFVPLAFNSGNVTQLLYLAMNVTIALTTALFLTRARISYRRIVGAYLIGGYVVVFIAFWQFANRIAGVPFPDEILYSNPGWSIVHQSFGAVPRIQATFSEPAALAFYLSGLCFCCLWLSAHGYRLLRVNLLLGLSIVAMLLSTSTTGLVVLALGLPAMLVFIAVRSDARALVRTSRLVGLLALGGALVIGPVFVLQPKLADDVSAVLSSTMDKSSSESYEERTSIDDAALASLGTTDGLGVGWGGFRTSSLLPGLVANGGVFAVLATLWLAYRMARMSSTARRRSPGHEGTIVLDGFTAALVGQLAAAFLSAPTIGSLAFFIQLGCVAGVAGRMANPVTVRRDRPSRLRALMAGRGPIGGGSIGSEEGYVA